MTNNSEPEQRSLFELGFDANSDHHQWKIEAAKKRLPNFIEHMTELEKLIQKIICPENLATTNLNNLLKTQKLSSEETLKVQICFLVAHEGEITIAELYSSLYESIHGRERMQWGRNCFVWDKISKEGIKAIDDLIDDDWIDRWSIDSERFLTRSSLSKSPFPGLPIADIRSAYFLGYARPHWLPVIFQPGLKLIAFKLADDKTVQDAIQSLEAELSFPTTRSGSLTEENIFPDEIDSGKSFKEGAVHQVNVNAYERNSQARQKCIEYYGTRCCVCELDLGEKYGKIGEGFIHVHHLHPLSEIAEEYEVDPVKDLRPVCPNCHAIIHRYNPPLKIEDMKAILESPPCDSAT